MNEAVSEISEAPGLDEQIRNIAWARTSLGLMETWPQSLLTTLSIVLNSKFPMFLLWGPDHVCFYNDAYLPGLSSHQKTNAILGKPAGFVSHENWDAIAPVIQNILAGGKSTWTEDEPIPIFENENSSVVYWTSSYSAVNDESGKPAGVLKTCTITTEKILQLRQLIESQTLFHENDIRFRSLVDKAPAAIAVFEGPEFIIRVANPHVLEYWDRTLEQVLDKPLFEVLPEAAGQGYEELLRHILQTGERFTAKELSVNLRRNNKIEKTYINFVYDRYNDLAKDDGKIIVVATEITAQVVSRQRLEQTEEEMQLKIEERTKDLAQAYEKLEILNEELKKSNENLKEFAYSASHDIKEPIRKILVFSDLLRPALEGLLKEDDLNYFKKIYVAANRMNALIDNVLAYSQVTGAENRREDVDVGKLIQQIKSDFDLLITEKNAVIQSENLPVVKGIPQQLNQMFQNIISNALKFQKHPTHPVINITSRRISGKDVNFPIMPADMNKPFHLIDITDNGIGFHQEDAERIFGIFTRLHGKTQFEGTGIGLSIAKQIIDNHKGYIHASSAPNEGTTFHILLPA